MFGIPNIESAVSNFLEGRSGIGAIRQIEFDKRYLWVADFVSGPNSLGAPEPFNDLFPASDVTFGMTNVSDDVIKYGQSELAIPLSDTARDITMTFYDSNDQKLLKYFIDWIEIDIKNKGAFMSGLNDSHRPVVTPSLGSRTRVYPTRQLRLIHMDAFKSQNSVYNFIVFPKGSIDYNGSQGSEAQEYTLSFAVVDDLGSKPTSSAFGNFSFNDVKQIIGRFI